MMKSKLILSITAVLIGFVSHSQQKKWTLQECVDYALENNITVRQGENTILSNEQDIRAAKGQFLPSVSATASHTLGLGTERIDVGNTQVVVERSSNSTNFGVSLNQTVFDGFRLTNLYKQSQLNIEASELELNRIKDDISLNVANSYLNVLFNIENLDIAEAQYEFSKKQLERVKELVESGAQPEVNIYDAQATLSRDQQSVTVAENNYELSLLSLAQLLQLPFEGFQIEVIALDDPSVELMYKDARPIINYALENRNEIKVAEKNIEVSELGTEISKSGYYPSVTFGYGFGSNAFYTNLYDTEAPFFTQLNDQKGHNFRLNINIPIFSQFQNKTNVAKAKIQEEQAKLNLEQAKVNLEANVQRAFTDAKAALRAYEAAKLSLESQDLAFKNAEERYNIGAMNAFDLEQARLSLINAESSLINAKYDFIFKTKVLDFYLGKPVVID